MKAPNPLSPFLMTPAERRAELCRILARGLVRLRQRICDEASRVGGDSSLHYRADQRLHANPTERRNA